MEIEDIYNKFDQIGCLTFATIDKNYPQTRIAHLYAYDDEGLYFRTMITKAFYDQLIKTKKVSLCGMYPKTTVSYNEKGEPYFPPGYTIRASGDVKEISLDLIKEKAKKNKKFELGVMDTEKYSATISFCLYQAWGEVFAYDFEKAEQSHKLLRTEFSFGGKKIPFRGMKITDKCVACGKCVEKCSFESIYVQNEIFKIDVSKCDICGDCYQVCPFDAIEIVIDDPDC